MQRRKAARKSRTGETYQVRHIQLCLLGSPMSEGDVTKLDLTTAIDLYDAWHRVVKQVWSTNRCVLLTFFQLNSSFSEFEKKRITDGRTDERTDGQTLL